MDDGVSYAKDGGAYRTSLYLVIIPYFSLIYSPRSALHSFFLLFCVVL